MFSVNYCTIIISPGTPTNQGQWTFEMLCERKWPATCDINMPHCYLCGRKFEFVI